MELECFVTKILSIKADIQSLNNNVTEQDHLKLPNYFIDSFSVLAEFIEDDLNITVLKKYSQKSMSPSEQCPLDVVCKAVLDKLTEIDVLLNKEIVDTIRLYISRPELEKHHSFNHNLNVFISKLRDISFLNLMSAYTVLKHLDGHSKTLIILGPNGSGKTSFANYLKNLDTHVKVIPASKPIIATGYIPSMYNSTLSNYNEELYRGGVLQQELLLKLIIGICSEHDNIARTYMDTGLKERASTYEKIKEIFDDFFEVKLDNSAFALKQMKAQKEQISFDFNNMSDGERVAFFYIATVIAAPIQSFIIVDEPENHLNPAIYNKIWERLIDYRKDCQFIFISHTIEFVSARSNFELARIKRFVYPDKFEFDFLGNTLENVQTELVIEILGSRKPILFCEGSKSDYDYKVYEILFGKYYTILPTGNCSSVERSVEACNVHATVYGIQSAIGIIDSDLKGEEEIERLKQKKVYTLRCNEIEMLLIDEAILKKSLERVFKPVELFESFKNDLFCKLEERKSYIIKRLVKTRVDEMLRRSFIDDKTYKTKDDIKINLKTIYEKVDVDTIWEDCESGITSIISQKDYEGALRFCCLEHGEILSGLGNRLISDYAAIALGVLRDDNQLSISIREKYFQDIYLN